MNTEDIRCSSPDATRRAGTVLAGVLQAGDLLGLVGDLGAGKTLMVQGIALGLKVPSTIRVTSPTFTLINEYLGGRVPLYHADLYRLERERELDELGIDDLCRRADGILAVEWCDRFAVLPADHLQIHIQIHGGSERLLCPRGNGPRSAAIAAAWVGAVTGS